MFNSASSEKYDKWYIWQNKYVRDLNMNKGNKMSSKAQKNMQNN